MLSAFIQDRRTEIIQIARQKLLVAMPVSATEEGVANAVPILLDDLIRELPSDAPVAGQQGRAATARRFGDDLHRLGFTLSQVVHGYGAVCQVVTALADEHQTAITAHEFHILNLLLDEAIAEAVTQFDKRRSRETRSEEVVQLGFLAHELRNALVGAQLSATIIRSGKAGVFGKTADVLDRSLSRMRDLIDRSMAAVRLHTETRLLPEPMRLLDLIDDIETTAAPDAMARGVQLSMRVSQPVELTTDRQFLVSAISNLVQNAIKYTRPGTLVQLRAREADGGRVIVEVEDACGGLPAGRAEHLFKAFVQGSSDHTGLGLGLTIAHQAAERLGGDLHVRDLPGHGCVFTLNIPKAVELSAETTHARTAIESSRAAT